MADGCLPAPSRFLFERGGARAGDHHLPGVEPTRRLVESISKWPRKDQDGSKEPNYREATGRCALGRTCGLCVWPVPGRTLITQFDSLYSTGIVLSGALLILVLIRTSRAVRPLAAAKHTTSETAKKSARQFLAACIFCRDFRDLAKYARTAPQGSRFRALS